MDVGKSLEPVEGFWLYLSEIGATGERLDTSVQKIDR